MFNQEPGNVWPKILIAVLLVVGVGVAAWAVLGGRDQSGSSGDTQSVASTENSTVSADEPPARIKHIGITLGTYDPATGAAGDVVFTKTGLESYGNRLFFDYGAIAEANSAAEARRNPQPTFILPLGTKVRALIDGVVVGVPELYSKDYSIQIATTTNSQWLYELEHVINPVVKEGDTVKAGQVVAEVSTHDSQYHPGFGLYEIGILHAGNPPAHVCPFAYLDASIKDKTYAQLTQLYASWEEYIGDTSLYDETEHVVPGCTTLERVEG